MKIERNLLQDSLLDFSMKGNGIIVGSPGAGKTYSLSKLTKNLESLEIPYLILQVDRLGNITQAEINTVLELDMPLSTKLKSEYFNTEKPGIIIIDGFDAARNLEAQENLLFLIADLITSLRGGWNLLVSVRSFDARKSKSLIKLFPKNKINLNKSFQDEEMDCSHFLIPPLTEKEVLELESQITGITNLYQTGSNELRNILSIPFNLWLLEKLSKKDKALKGVNIIASEVQLLEMFWKEYVTTSKHSSSMENLLTQITKKMVDKFSLSERKEMFYTEEIKEVWNSLLSSEILQESQFSSQQISFSHNILFDYAVSILIIDEKPEELILFLIAEPARSLFLRPSLVYYYTRLWFINRDLFWNSFVSVLEVLDQNLRLFARIVPASVAVKLISKQEDFEYILKLNSTNKEIHTEIIVRLFQAYEFIGSSKDIEWCNFMNKLVDNIQNEYLGFIAKVTNQILSLALANNDQNIIDVCGEIGRKLLKWIWENRKGVHGNWLDNIGAELVVPIIMKTFSTDFSNSEKLLRNVLAIVKEQNFSIRYIYRLTDSISLIWPTSPELVSDIYKVVFNYQELSKEQTSMGTPIMPLLSNRKQDFDMCHYQLIKSFPDFLNEKPICAVNAAFDCLGAYIEQEHLLKNTKEQSELDNLVSKFDFRGSISSYVTDHSCIWDARDSYKDEQIKIGLYLFKYIEENSMNKIFMEENLDIFSKKAIAAYWWKNLLELGAKQPEVFASYLYELCIVVEIIDGMDTEHEAVKFITSAWMFFTEEQRKGILTALMSIKYEDEIRQKYAVQLQEKIISRLPKNTINHSLALSLKEKLVQEGRVVVNPVPYKIETKWGKYSEDEFLQDQGTDINLSEIRTLKASWSSLSELNQMLLNGTPTKEQVFEIIKRMKSLCKLLQPQPITLDKAALNTAWTELGSAAEILARYDLGFQTEEYNFVKKVLLDCCKIENPYPREDEEASFTSPGYSTFARTEAAQGLPWLVRLGEDKDVLAAITNLLKDNVPSVRYLVSREIWRMRETSSEFLWNTISDRVKIENNAVVLGALSYSLGHILFENEVKATEIAKNIFEKMVTITDNENIKSILNITIWLHLDRQNAWASETINDIANNPLKYKSILSLTVSDLLAYLKPKTLEKEPLIFNAAKLVLSQITSSVLNEIRTLNKKPFEQWDDSDKEQLKSLYSPIDNIITRIYFAADVTPSLRRKDKEEIINEVRKNYYHGVKPLLTKILDETLSSGGGSLFAPTAHHFMELLVGVIQYDVSGVLQMAADLARSSEGTGYSLDSMAIREVVNLTERVLADYRYELRKSENIENLLRLLDVFAKNGWSDALKLVWRLDEIYR